MSYIIDQILARESVTLSDAKPGRRRNGRELSSEMADHWWREHEELEAFARVLYEGDELNTARDVLDFLEKPMKWTEARDNWILAGEPDAWKVER
jgi:hypothetical protein